MGRTLFSSFNSELTLTNLTQADAGKYTCIGQNTQGLVQEEIILDIQGKTEGQAFIVLII